MSELRWPALRHAFDIEEIIFVAENMDCHTRDYVIKTRRAALSRARRKDWPLVARNKMRTAADRMKYALKNWPKGKFDSTIPDAEGMS